MSYPKGFGSTDHRGRRKVALLKKPIYGHPSSARAWAKTVFEWSEEFFIEFYYSVENYYALMRVEYYWGLGQPMVLLRTGYFMGLIAHACISLHCINK